MIEDKVNKKEEKTWDISKVGVDALKFNQLLKKHLGTLSHDTKLFKNVPVVMSSNSKVEFSRLTNLLNDVFEKIVLNYFNDERIQQLYQLDKELEDILVEAYSIPYKVGMYRPDLVFDMSGVPKICEIGCRYPINGWMISYYINEILNELKPKEVTEWDSIDEQLGFITNLSNDFDIKETLYYVHNKEKGTEAYLMFNELHKLGFTIKDVSPNDFEVIEGKLIFEAKEATQFILEMDREELKQLKPSVLKALIRSKKCINDVRSIILIHDKKVLAALYDEQIMRRYVNSEDYNFLKKYLIPSYTLDLEIIRDQLINSNANWVLKKSSGGRGLDMFVKNECSSDTWRKIINEKCSEYMVQEYIPQKKFSIENDKSIEEINIVGMLLAYNENSFGLGVYRGSKQSIINVHSGAYVLPSAIRMK
ncbi:hypothetical protein [Tenacibaculum halocynthiae]|uniref:hypothetical protein n=1 Tax=Tenacibaculum halocynthiae TaxID=1254437 RepID=UPI003D65A116